MIISAIYIKINIPYFYFTIEWCGKLIDIDSDKTILEEYIKYKRNLHCFYNSKNSDVFNVFIYNLHIYKGVVL